MKLAEAKLEFVQTWGSIGSSWGIPKSMAQIHALLLASKNELSTEDVMETIQLSRGNVNINMRELINWNLVSKQSKLGERREFFTANTDIMAIAQKYCTGTEKERASSSAATLTKIKRRAN